MSPHPSVLLVILAAAACSTSGAVRPPAERVILSDERTGATIRATNDQVGAKTVLPAPVDKVWEAVASSYAMLKINRTYVNRATGEQGNPKLLMSRTFDRQAVSTYLSCGDDPFAGPNANAYPVTVSIITRVVPEGNGTALRTLLSGTVTKVGANSGGIYCATTGALEVQLAKMVASRL